MSDDPIALGPGEGEMIEGSRYLAARRELSFSEGVVEPRSGVAPHFHKGHSDSFYVLEGEVEFHVGDEVVLGTPGSYVLSPPNVVHSFRNVSDKSARILNLHTPGGFAEYRRELEELRSRGIEPDDAFFERHDVFGIES